MIYDESSLWPYIVGGVLAVLFFAIVIRRLRTPSRSQMMEQKMRRDATDPLRAWCQAAFMIVTRDCDYAYLGEAEARKMLREDLVAAAPLFATKPYFLSEEFSLVDCTLAPLLWRLPSVGIELPREARTYAQRIFARDAFQKSLSEPEREMAELPLKLSA